MKAYVKYSIESIFKLLFIALAISFKSCSCNECKDSNVSKALTNNDANEPALRAYAAFTAFNCEAILKDGLFRYDYIRYNEKYRYYFYDYVYQSDLRTEDDVINSGIGLDLPTDIGIPIGITGHFDLEKHRLWRSEYEHERTVMETRDIAFENIRRYADTSITNNWLRCKYLESRSREKGVQLLIEDAGSDRVILTAAYDPLGNNDPYAKIKSITLNGGILVNQNCNPFKNGEKIGPGGISSFVKREKDKALSIILETDQGAKTIRYPAPPPLNIMVFTASSDEIYKGDSVSLNWEIKSATKVTLNGNNVSSKDQIKVKLDSTKQFQLIALGIFGDSIKTNKTIRVVERPIVLTGGRIIFTVPAWADGKDNDTHITVEIKNSRGVVISSYVNNRSDWPIENSSYTDNVPITIDRQSIELRQEYLTNCTATITKYPNGNDKVTLYLNLEFVFSNNSESRLGSAESPDVIRMLDQGQQSATIRLKQF